MALLVVGAVLAALPVLAGGVPGWGGAGGGPPFVVLDQGTDIPAGEATGPTGNGAATDPPAIGDLADPSDDRDRDRDDDSGGSGGGDSGGGGSSGPG